MMNLTSDFGMKVVLAVLASTSCVAPALGKEPQARPEILQTLVNCRAVADSAARLACFDAQVARLDAAESNKELVVVDKEEIRKARKGLFGLALPDLGGLFGGGDEKKDEPLGSVSEIESTIKSARADQYGNWSIIIADGARWVQTEPKSMRDPKPGQAIRIRKAALGSFMANVNGQTGFKVKRVN